MEKQVKCEGRFSGLRDYIYEEVFPVVSEDLNLVDRSILNQAWDLMKGDIYTHDIRDPYFQSSTNIATADILRKRPNENYLSLVPLVQKPIILDKHLIEEYLIEMGNSKDCSAKLAEMGDNPSNFLEKNLGKNPKNIILPGNKSFQGYVVQGNFGVGTISYGGVLGGGIRSDSPFLLEVYKKMDDASQLNLAGVVGFWVQDNSMLVSQMQSCKNAHMPEDVHFGVSGLRLAEEVARGIGLEKVLAYNARSHPHFKEHSKDWEHLGRDFTCMWDGSAKKLGYDGSRNLHYEKSLHK